MTKKEARILGLAAASGELEPIPVIGIVFRGNLWLDGIFRCQIRTKEHDCMSRLVSAIVRLRQYPQIHAVVIPKEALLSRVLLDISDFSNKINLPVISIARRGLYRKEPTDRGLMPKSRTDVFSIRVSGRLVHVKVSGISREETKEILDVACMDGQQIPEALRVAKIVAAQVARRPPISNRKQRLNRTL